MMQLSQRARMGFVLRWFEACWQSFRAWLEAQGIWWAVSVVAHAIVLSSLLLVLGVVVVRAPNAATPRVFLDTSIIPEPPQKLEMLPPETVLPPETADLVSLEAIIESVPDNDNAVDVTATSDDFPTTAAEASISDSGGGLGGLSGGFTAVGPGKLLMPGSGNGGGSGDGTGGFGDRENRRKRPGGDRTKSTDAAVGRALVWIARHQDPTGRWSLSEFSRHCSDATCTCKAGNSDTAATALGLLPFLAGGQTPKKGLYNKNVSAGLYWLVSQQKTNGDLRSGNGNMYAHGLATITLCEAYGLTKDRQVGAAAQQAIRFIVSAQDRVGGGWRYEPGQPGDTSVAAWQIMALKSGMMAGLEVPSSTIEQAAKFLKSVGTGDGGFGYQDPGKGLATSAAGLLCTQYLGATRENETVRGGVQLLLANLPREQAAHPYYWYYATQVMHNMNDTDWDTWNRRIRRLLVETQEHAGCAAGSWTPAGQTWGENGGRLMVTALNTLTLEVYYRNLPLYRVTKR